MTNIIFHDDGFPMLSPDVPEADTSKPHFTVSFIENDWKLITYIQDRDTAVELAREFAKLDALLDVREYDGRDSCKGWPVRL